MCTEYIDSEFKEVDVHTDYDDLNEFHPVDKHAIYAAFGAKLWGHSPWKITFEGRLPTLQCTAADKKLFHQLYDSIRGLDMMIPALQSTMVFTKIKSIQSYVLLRKYRNWQSFCQAGPSKIYERLQCKPDLMGEFIAAHIVCRKDRSQPGSLDPSQFKTVRGGAFTVRENGYGIQLGRGDPNKYNDVAAMALLDFKDKYEEWCNSSEERVPFKDYFQQPKINPIRNELAKYNIVCMNPGFDLTPSTQGTWKKNIQSSDYMHKKYVLLGCHVRND